MSFDRLFQSFYQDTVCRLILPRSFSSHPYEDRLLLILLLSVVHLLSPNLRVAGLRHQRPSASSLILFSFLLFALIFLRCSPNLSSVSPFPPWTGCSFHALTISDTSSSCLIRKYHRAHGVCSIILSATRWFRLSTSTRSPPTRQYPLPHLLPAQPKESSTTLPRMTALRVFSLPRDPKSSTL